MVGDGILFKSAARAQRSVLGLGLSNNHLSIVTTVRTLCPVKLKELANHVTGP